MPEGLNAGSVYATMKLYTDGFERGLQTVVNETDKASDKIDKRMEKLKDVMRGVANSLLTIGSVGAAGMAGMVKMANDAVESENLFTVSLGKNSEAVRACLKACAKIWG